MSELGKMLKKLGFSNETTVNYGKEYNRFEVEVILDTQQIIVRPKYAVIDGDDLPPELKQIANDIEKIKECFNEIR